MFALGCSTEVVSTVTACDVQISVKDSSLVEPLTFEIEEPLSPVSMPQLIELSTRTVLDVNRDSCAECDECRDIQGCSICQDCDECDTICEATCEATLAIEIPDISPGSVQLQIYNSYGQSNALEIHVVRSPPAETEPHFDTATDSADPTTDQIGRVAVQ